jgi:F-type H+-transporting ATPase subunit gamma
MANIKDLKKKIKSTQGTHKITSAMKLVSAAKLAKAQQRITSSRPYANELESTIKTISALVQNYEHDYLKASDNKQAFLLVISSNKGLCGGYNSQIAKKVRSYLTEHGENTKVLWIGKKAKALLEDEVNSGKMFEFEKQDPTFTEVQSIANELATSFKNGEVGSISIAYNVFQSALAFTPTVKQLLPMTLNESEKEELQKEFPFDFKYDPKPEAILDALIPEVYISSIYTCLLDANAAEHGSRMSSMDSAANNCKDAIKSLTLKMNKLRQAAITTELIEVISGAESLNG